MLLFNNYLLKPLHSSQPLAMGGVFETSLVLNHAH